jgi:hypothetical protein
MARDWISVLGTKWADWVVPEGARPFIALAGAAQTAPAEAKTETTRTPVATAKCKSAFEAMKDKMRHNKANAATGSCTALSYRERRRPQSRRNFISLFLPD